MNNREAFTGLYGYYERSNISTYKMFFLLYKDDFNKAVEECLKFATGFIYSRIDRINTK